MTSELPGTMDAVLLTGYGGFDKLEYHDDVPVPTPGNGEVLIRVGAAGINNAVICDWTDAELASIPCAYSAAENMLHRSNLSPGETVLVTGASGGVGSAAVQLARRRGATVIAVSGKSKATAVQSLGAQHVIDRGESMIDAVGKNRIDVVVDLVAGPQWPQLLEVLRNGGRYAWAGAIARPMVDLDVRTLYLKDLSLLGCTFQEDIVFENLVGYIEKDEIRPLVDNTYPLKDIVSAQKDFLAKQFVGKLVLVPEGR